MESEHDVGPAVDDAECKLPSESLQDVCIHIDLKHIVNPKPASVFARCFSSSLVNTNVSGRGTNNELIPYGQVSLKI